MNTPLVSIIVPYQDEAEFIGRVLESLINQDYPKDKIEIIAVDSNSRDDAPSIVADYGKKDNRIKAVHDPKGTTSTSMNIGIKNAKGDLITKSDAHTIYPPDYVSKCARYLKEYKTDAVGGVTDNVPADDSPAAKAIVEVLSSPLGGGGAFRRSGGPASTRSPRIRVGAGRRGEAGKPRLADTAFGICYRREVFDRIGLFNENLIRSQDFDFNLRLTQAGGKILLAPDIILTYYPKQKTIISFWQRNFLDGIWAILPLKFGSPIFKPRHLAPLAFVSTILTAAIGSIFIPPLIWVTTGILTFYLAAALYFSLKIISKEKSIQLLPFIILAFAARHFAYGLGSLVGVIKLIIPR